MSILETILKASNGDLMQSVAKNMNLDSADTSKAIAAMMPYLKNGMQNNLKQEGGLESLLGALAKGKHDRFLDSADDAVSDTGMSEGLGILKHLLGEGKEQEVVSELNSKLDLDSGAIAKLLPVAATMMMGAMSKNKSNLKLDLEQEDKGMFQNAILGFLDKDKDGSIVDDLLSSAMKRFF